ncbi:MAG: type I restriction-modification system subunit M [Treponema sp.]|nr:type I restriction-modification system subunit M [Treponema sp.]
MDTVIHNQIVNFIWGIADDCLRDVYVRGKYRNVILPMTVIRRLDAVLEPTKEKVLEMKKNLDKNKISNQTSALCSAAGQAFCNSSLFNLRDLTARSTQAKLRTDFNAYLNGFSSNVQEILLKFKFRDEIPTMLEADILGAVVEKFVSPKINLSPNPVLDEKGKKIMSGLDNHSMGTIFEELIRMFNEENNEEAGEHFTPRDVVELMADLIFTPIADKILDSTYSCYDGACGSGGMLTVAEKRLVDLAAKKKKKVSIRLFGQEIQGETYAIAKADLLLKGEGAQSDNISFGSTLSNDNNSSREFDFMLSNPPYGKSWKVDADKMGGKKGIIDSRFIIPFEGDGEFNMIPRSSDGQLLFLLNNVSKMKKDTPTGSRIAEVHNGSSLFTGDAGQGESNARRYMIEKDLVEAVIALPEKMFYNTGIATFIWILSNKKEKKRKGKIQLIDATSIKTPLRKNLGDKNCELSAKDRKKILDLYLKFEENEYSRIFNLNEFAYWKITVCQPMYDETGKILKDKKDNPQADSELTDTEQIPFTYEGGIETFFEKEVKPYTKNAWIDERQTKIGYEISFTKYFYKPIELRPLEEITADIKALETETKGLLEKIIGD